jgi:predicted DsbA family dithiol-disulfide isomerase
LEGLFFYFRQMEIHIWSDVACPFCYIGRAHLIKALQETGLEHVNFTWHSFQLDPSINREDEGRGIAEHLSEKKGMSLSQVQQMMDNVSEMASDAGLKMQLSTSKVFNTLSCHLLLQYAKSLGKGDALKQVFFERHFLLNQNLADMACLDQALMQVGILDVSAADILSDSQWMSKMEDDLYTAQQFNIRGVPLFVFDSKYALSGAQPVDVFVKVLKQTLADQQ